MIITRAPLRLTFGGGGTDLPSYYRKFGGELVSAAIDKYIYIAIHRTFSKEFIIKYSQYERVATAKDVKHPIIREILTRHQVEPQLEIISLADIPDGTGLGSSGAFSVALLKAISFYQRQPVLTEQLAQEACDIEINALSQPVGKQDQYAAAFGGITRFIFHKDDSVEVAPVKLSSEALLNLEYDLLLFFTGFSRSAGTVLSEQKQKSESMDKAMLANLHFTKELGTASFKALEEGNMSEFARLMDVHWENKRQRTAGMSKSAIDQAYQAAKDNGALGGKLIGAGGGGFLMFYTKQHEALRAAMAKEGLDEVRFKFDFEGVKAVTV
ncbi:MAG: galactokinase [Deltaproteobacteria bacterium]|nr:galactokinase [Deltaproteobacteria bacterium]